MRSIAVGYWYPNSGVSCPSVSGLIDVVPMSEEQLLRQVVDELKSISRRLESIEKALGDIEANTAAVL